MFGKRLRYKDSGAFPCETKSEIEHSAEYALEIYQREAIPWFDKLNLKIIKENITKGYL